MSNPKVLFGFHAVGVRLKTAPKSVVEIYFDPTRRDARMRQFVDRVNEAGVRPAVHHSGFATATSSPPPCARYAA
jgi:hypothetical protein